MKKNRVYNRLKVFFGLATGLSACNFYQARITPENLSAQNLSWAKVSSAVFQASCIECHSQLGGTPGPGRNPSKS